MRPRAANLKILALALLTTSWIADNLGANPARDFNTVDSTAWIRVEQPGAGSSGTVS